VGFFAVPDELTVPPVAMEGVTTGVEVKVGALEREDDGVADRRAEEVMVGVYKVLEVVEGESVPGKAVAVIFEEKVAASKGEDVASLDTVGSGGEGEDVTEAESEALVDTDPDTEVD
jgi:hypothetical protein